MQMFQNTLSIPIRTIRSWLDSTDIALPQSRLCKKETQQVRLNGEVAAERIRSQIAEDFVDRLDKVPSHYCRQSSKKNYLWPYDFRSAAHVHSVYSKWLAEEHPETKVVSLTKFKEILKTKNIAIWQPRKDLCDTCSAYNLKNVSEEIYQQHILLKDSARSMKQADKLMCNDKLLMLTVDVQAVQTIPKKQASCLYFRTKLNLHNYTVYNCSNQDVCCYVWTEVNGGLTSNIFTSCLIDYLLEYQGQHPDLEGVIIWSDGCGAQNRNTTLLSALSVFNEKTGIPITMKYLEKGHTQMECDSVHAKLEKFQDNVDLDVPSDYCKLVKEARKQPFPFRCKFLTYDFFLIMKRFRFSARLDQARRLAMLVLLM